MSRLGYKSSVVYHGELCLGELGFVPVKEQTFQFPNNEIRIHHLSPVSERCPPLSILQTISSFSVICKLESPSPSPSPPIEQPHLINLHASCFYELKTAVVLLRDEEIHLVAMPSKQKKFPCFWCYSVPSRLYDSCLGMLNLRCLAIVFDLDETLIVANTMKSFEDRIEVLKGWISRETDPVRLSGMTAELKRYVDDRALLKQYTENDIVSDNGKVYKVQHEEVQKMSDTHDRVVRPIIRLQEKNIVFTRINPEIRDTSVLVRLRPAWEDLRSYLIAKGRKRFEVYVCTMAERDYALEMWRLLDPEAHLIGPKQLVDRVVCVKSGAKKSLLNVFQDGICHPKMAMVIDDRLKVWEDKDQPRVHVVPPFTPYYAPQAETANAVPVLCVARNVACNVRGGFFKEFDENLLRRIFELFYEDEVVTLPPSPDVSNYLMSEDAGLVPNGSSNAPAAEGLTGAEVERRLSQSDEKNTVDSSSQSTTNGSEKRSEISQQPAAGILGQASSRTILPLPKPSLLGAPVRRDGIIHEPDPDSKRRLLIMKHGQDVRSQSLGEPPILSRFPPQISATSVQPLGGRLVEDVCRGQLNTRASGFAQECDAMKIDRPKVQQTLLGHGTPASTQSALPSHAYQVKSEEPCPGNEKLKQNILVTCQPLEFGSSQNQASANSREAQGDAGKVNSLPSLSIGVLQEIGRRCGSKVEFRSVVSTSKDLQFSVEVLLTGEKIGVGMGKTRKDAQQQAADNALHSLADKYTAYIAPRAGAVDKDFDKLSIGNENGFVWDDIGPESEDLQATDDDLPKPSASEAAEVAVGSTSSNIANHLVQKRANSPRLPQSIPSKRSKEDLLRGPQSLSSSRVPKNGHSVV